MLKAQHSAGGAALAVTMLIAFSHVAAHTRRAAAVPPERPDVPAGTTTNSPRTFQNYDIEEVFSNHDGSVQFVELRETAGEDGHFQFAGNQLRSSTNVFTFPTDLPSPATANRSVLIATASFAALPGAVTPDYIIPEHFFEVSGDTISIFDVQMDVLVDTFVFGGPCPCDGDVDGDGVVNIVDVLDVYECATGFVPPSDPQCDLADVNCDGIVDTCDMSRVTCYFYGQTECCYDNSVCGACCSDGGNFRTCEVVSADTCASPLFWGTYKGDGTVCDPWPCDATECTTDANCNDENVCTEDTCAEGTCVYENLPNGAACPDDSFCNGDETCYAGACQSGPPRSCDDALACTTDTCNEAEDVCVHIPAECNNDGVCDSPCENVDNCPADCDECPCVLDQDGDGLIKIQDLLNVVTCAEGDTPTPPLTCDQADLNCDGEVDFCDVSRVYCGFVNHPDCCVVEFVCGACCNSGANFDHPCLVVSEEFCYSVLIEEGDYLGDGTVCDPWPCDGTERMMDDDCDDKDSCTGPAAVFRAIPPDGACCNVGNGQCQDGVPEVDCTGIELVWMASTACSALSCLATPLPTDGALSLNSDGTTGINSPTNFAGEMGSVNAAASIPTMSRTSLVVMMLLFVTAAVVITRTRRRGISPST